MKNKLASVVFLAGSLLAGSALAEQANPILSKAKAHVLTLDQSKLVKGKGSTSQYYGYYGMVYSYYSYAYGVYSYSNDVYGSGPTYYKAASDYAYAAYVLYFYAYYYV